VARKLASVPAEREKTKKGGYRVFCEYTIYNQRKEIQGKVKTTTKVQQTRKNKIKQTCCCVLWCAIICAVVVVR